jgi:hypothetical protein
MSNVARGQDFASAVGKSLDKLGLAVESEYSVEVGIGSKSTKQHRFDFGSSEVLVECKCYGWTQGGNNPSAKVSTLNEAMMYFHSTPGKYRKMLFLPLTEKSGVRNPQTFAEYYVRLHGHFTPANVEVWELDATTGQARQVGNAP